MSVSKIKKLLIEADRKEKAGKPRDALAAAEKALALNPDTASLRMYVAKLHNQLGHVSVAYRHYLHLRSSGVDDLNVRFNLADTLRRQASRAGDPEIESEILDCLDFDNIESNTLTRVTTARLVHKYDLRRNPDLNDLDILCADPFLHRTLQSIFFTSRELELMFMKIRRALLFELSASGALRGDRLPLIVAIARQCANNQYVYDFDSQEKELLESFMELQTALGLGEEPSIGLLGAVMAPAMYMPIAEMAIADKLIGLDLDEWPEIARPLVKSTLFDRYIEKEMAADMPSISPVVDQVSRLVKAQYETHPYPRWLTIGHKEPVSLLEDFRARFPGLPAPNYLGKSDLKVLVAGCGTGRQPISVAKSYSNVRVTAVDLSNMSLAYGLRMAAEMGLDTIDFIQGDILELAQLDQRFDVIYCSGVLHHMDDPIAGWTVLRDIINPGGLMNIGLYSERARGTIVRARGIVDEQKIGDDPDSIRAFRNDLFHGKFGARLEPLVHIGDFYSLSGCRDLIFNVQEHRFTLPQIDRIRKDLGLEIVGFNHVNPPFGSIYRKAFPDDPRMIDLDNWDKFEQDNPGMFLNMYNIWFQAG